MAKSGTQTLARRDEPHPASIRALSVEGFKSFGSESTIEVRPLTILAGANSSGKSSALQPLLLLKQTLEAPYDPGPLLLNGPNVKFTAAAQFICSQAGAEEGASQFSFGVSLHRSRCQLHFRKESGNTQPIELQRITVTDAADRVRTYSPGSASFLDTPWKDIFPDEFFRVPKAAVQLIYQRDRCFLSASISADETAMGLDMPLSLVPRGLETAILNTIHVAGHRGNPQRNYQVTAVGKRFPGAFEDYIASIVAAAQRDSDRAFLDQLGSDLQELGLTWKVSARAVDETQVELRVGRLPRAASGGANDLVSIADVGFGVSQTLPVVVALLKAAPRQLVYIEQPEIHLHPRAQHAMAALIARAAKRGVRVVIETHSSILLLGIQRLVAEDELDPGLVKLHWFQRDEKAGLTNVTSADLDAAGAFRGWPEDFDDVSLSAQQQYLDAAEKKLVP